MLIDNQQALFSMIRVELFDYASDILDVFSPSSQRFTSEATQHVRLISQLNQLTSKESRSERS